MLNLGLNKFRRILCLGAHSDDIEIGCGGTILRLIQENPQVDVHWVVFSSSAVRRSEALVSAEACALQAVKHRAQAASERAAGAAPLAQTPGSDSVEAVEALSRREVQVLELVAAGKDNKAIGATLFISPNTVAAHVRNILAKTGTSNRAEAAALAVRRGVLTRGEE